MLAFLTLRGIIKLHAKIINSGVGALLRAASPKEKDMSLLREGFSGETESAEVAPVQAAAAEHDGTLSRSAEKEVALAALEAAAIQRAGWRAHRPQAERTPMPDIDPAIMLALDREAASHVRPPVGLPPIAEVVDVAAAPIVELPEAQAA
jgi:hypothetical protein